MSNEDNQNRQPNSYDFGGIPLDENMAFEVTSSWWISPVLGTYLDFDRIDPTEPIVFLGSGKTCTETLYMRLLLKLRHQFTRIIAVDLDSPSNIGRKILTATSAEPIKDDYCLSFDRLVRQIGKPSAVVVRNPNIYVQNAGSDDVTYFPDLPIGITKWAQFAHTQGSQFLLTTEHPQTWAEMENRLTKQKIPFVTYHNNFFLQHPLEQVQRNILSNHTIQLHISAGLLPDQFVIKVN